ncbi:MAG: hypothetical protein VKS61_07635 [Candidatus Sericytochromatia bacterium]|nr:hypothetical protein [Candidatus Sericytochromatia bacterium]
MQREIPGWLTLALTAALLGCQAAPPTPADPASRAATRLPRALERATLIGVDGGTLIGVDGGSLIGVDGGTLIGVDGGSLVGEVKLPGRAGGYRLAATRPAAGVTVYVRDARGRFVYGNDRRLVSAVTDAAGRFTLKGWRAGKGLSFFVPLDAVDGVVRGFSALRPLNQPAQAPVRVTEASTMVAGWVETRVLKGVAAPEQALDRLTRAAVEEAEQAMGRVVLAQPAQVDWRADRLAALAEGARAGDQALDRALDTVHRLMTLAGVNPCDAGQLATEALLRRPRAVAVTPDGVIHVAGAGILSGDLTSSGLSGLVQLAGEPRRLEQVTGPCAPAAKVPELSFLMTAEDGALLGASVLGGLWRLAPGTRELTRWAGAELGGQPARDGLPGRQLALDTLSAATAARTGGVWLATGTSDTQPSGTLLRLDADAVVVSAVDLPREFATFKEQPVELTGPVTALAQAPDGALWGLQNHALWRLEAPDGGVVPGARRVVWHDPEASRDQAFASLLGLEDGSVLLATSDAQQGQATRGVYVAGRQHVIRRIDPNGKVAVFAGAGPPEPDRPEAGEGEVALGAAHFNRPTGLALDRDGTVLVADMGNGLLRRLDPKKGLVTVVAGKRQAATVLARHAALDQPRGLAFDAQGRLLVTESGSHTLRRLEDRRLIRLAGGVQGVAGDGGPVQASALDRPFELAVAGEAVFLVEGGGHLLRRYTPATGLIETVAGGGRTPLAATGQQLRAREVGGFRITALAIDPGGRPVIAAVPVEEGEDSFLGSSLASLSATLWRVEADGHLTHLGGNGSLGLGQALDGQPAREVGLGFVAGLATGPAGDLFLAEPMRGVVWRLDAQGVLHHLGGSQGLLVPDFTSPQQADMPAAEATLVCPVGLACDAAGNVYVAEAGTLGFERVVTAVGLRLSFENPGPGRVRCLTPDGRARILAGAGAAGELAEVETPIAVAADAKGRVAFIDHGTGQLRELVAGPPPGR